MFEVVALIWTGFFQNGVPHALTQARARFVLWDDRFVLSWKPVEIMRVVRLFV